MPQVFCRYFVHAQRPEDRILRRLVEKTETIRRQLGSAAPVLETRVTELLAGGIGRGDIDRLEAEIARIEEDEKQRRARADLTPVREADTKLVQSLESLRSLLERSRRLVGVDRAQLARVVRQGLRLAEGPAPVPLDGDRGPPRFVFPAEALAAIRDSGLRRTIEALRPRSPGRDDALRPIAFEPPEDTDVDTVQLHLEHPLVARLLDRFSNQGLVHHDLQRACLAVSPDAVPRVVLLGRLSLWGEGAARLHEEIVRVAARWIEPELRKGPLKPYAKAAEAETMAALDRALDEPERSSVDPGRRQRLLATTGTDVADLRPELERRAEEAETEAIALLAQRGRIEAQAMRELIEQQRKRLLRQLGRDDRQLELGLNPAEQSQLRLDRQAWQDRLGRIDQELRDQPAAIEAGYVVKARRLEPVGLVYLWPVTG